MARHHLINGTQVPFTAEELANYETVAGGPPVVLEEEIFEPLEGSEYAAGLALDEEAIIIPTTTTTRRYMGPGTPFLDGETYSQLPRTQSITNRGSGAGGSGSLASGSGRGASRDAGRNDFDREFDIPN